jgi:hypothetical protein
MANNKIIKTSVLLASIVFSSTAFAGTAVVNWQNTHKYTDIDSANLGKKSMLNSIDKSFTKEFNELAAKLPVGFQLTITVTDLDLAGEVEPSPFSMMDQIRLLKDLYIPKITFDYQVLSAGGVSILEAKNFTLKDMQYLSGLRSTQSSESYYYERKMISEWFTKDVLPNVK